MIEYDSFTKAMDSGKCFTARLRSGSRKRRPEEYHAEGIAARLRSGRASEGLKSIMKKA